MVVFMAILSGGIDMLSVIIAAGGMMPTMRCVGRGGKVVDCNKAGDSDSRLSPISCWALSSCTTF